MPVRKSAALICLLGLLGGCGGRIIGSPDSERELAPGKYRGRSQLLNLLPGGGMVACRVPGDSILERGSWSYGDRTLRLSAARTEVFRDGALADAQDHSPPRTNELRVTSVTTLAFHVLDCSESACIDEVYHKEEAELWDCQ